MCDDNHDHEHHHNNANNLSHVEELDLSAIDKHRVLIEPLWITAFASRQPTDLCAGWHVWTRDHYSTSVVIGPSTKVPSAFVVRLAWADGSTSDHNYSLSDVRVATEPHVFVWPSTEALRARAASMAVPNDEIGAVTDDEISELHELALKHNDHKLAMTCYEATHALREGPEYRAKMRRAASEQVVANRKAPLFATPAELAAAIDPVLESSRAMDQRTAYNYEQGYRAEPMFDDPTQPSARDMFPSECSDRD